MADAMEIILNMSQDTKGADFFKKVTRGGPACSTTCRAGVLRFPGRKDCISRGQCVFCFGLSRNHPFLTSIPTMREYLDLVERVLANGKLKHNRTGTDTLSCFAEHYSVDLGKGYPLLTTKKMNFRAMLHEVLWYLSGEDHIRNLRQHTKIWDAWADENGNLDTAYGRYWRRFPSARLNPGTGRYEVVEIDQIGEIIRLLKTDPNSRRMVVTAWEPGNALNSKLPPCHYTFAFNVLAGKLNCHLTQRSGDIAIGIPFNLAAYALLTQVLAQEAGLEPGTFSHTIVDAHIYVNHIDGLKEQLKRTPRPLPRLEIARKPIDELQFEDFTLVGYECDEPIKFAVAV
jgi:thymidylate synthase